MKKKQPKKSKREDDLGQDKDEATQNGSPRKGFGPVSATLVTLGIFFGAQIGAAVILGVYAAIQGLDAEVISRLVENSVTSQFIFVLLLEVISIYFLWLFISRRSISWRSIGVKKPSVTNLLLALPVFGVYFVLLIVIMAGVAAFLPGIDLEQEQQIGFKGAAGGAELTLVFMSLVLLPAVVEEILIRGFLYSGLVQKFSKVAAALIASIIFGLAHLQFGTGAPLLWVAAIDTFVLSMVLIWLREQTGNIWSGVVVHMIKNGLAFVSLLILKLA